MNIIWGCYIQGGPRPPFPFTKSFSLFPSPDMVCYSRAMKFYATYRGKYQKKSTSFKYERMHLVIKSKADRGQTHFVKIFYNYNYLNINIYLINIAEITIFYMEKYQSTCTCKNHIIYCVRFRCKHRNKSNP